MIEISIRESPFDAKTVDGIASVHRAAYSPDHLSAHFSSGMARSYYLHLATAASIVVVATEDDRVVGFVIGGDHIGEGVARFRRENRLNLARLALKQPKSVVRRAMRMANSKKRGNLMTGPALRLTSVAIAPAAQGSGLFSDLLATFEVAGLDLGFDDYGLSVQSTNKRALAAYLRADMKIDFEFDDSVYLSKRLTS